VGAALGIFLLPAPRDDWGLTRTMLGVALICALGLAATWFFRVETRGRSLEAVGDEGMSAPSPPSTAVPSSA
jgi:hypothetical protein